jgi:kinesin family protein 3/17
MLEIYNEKIQDLLSDNLNNDILLKDNHQGVVVPDQSMFKVENFKAMVNLFELGIAKRTTGSTEMNKESSRSHCIFSIIIEASENKCEENNITKSKLNLVDLAGSERQSNSLVQWERLNEAKSINASLFALGNVIRELANNKSFIQYRNSKLTILLKDSLGGNTKTILIANISPVCFNYYETLNTLQ